MARTVSSLSSPEPDSTRQLHLTDEQTKHYRRLAQEIVARTLQQEMRFRYADNETLDESEWKLTRSKDRMRVYKRAAPPSPPLASSMPGTATESRLPMTLGLGSLDGTLEDVLYGMHHKTTREMRSVAMFLNKAVADAAVLATIDSGTEDDPFRNMGIKWRVVRTPGPDRFIKDRDALTLEYMGIDADSNGVKYGFQLMRSVDLLDADGVNSAAAASANVVRGHLMFCCIYRQITQTIVGVFSRGVFDLSGELADFLSYFTAAEMVLGISRALDSAAAKRLTLLALQKELDPSQLMRGTVRLSTDSTDSMDGTAAPSKVSRNVCSLCSKKRFFLSSPHQSCKLCAKTTCAKCCVSVSLFAQPRNVKVSCCVACVLESRTLRVDPRDPLPEISLEAR